MFLICEVYTITIHTEIHIHEQKCFGVLPSVWPRHSPCTIQNADQAIRGYIKISQHYLTLCIRYMLLSGRQKNNLKNL